MTISSEGLSPLRLLVLPVLLSLMDGERTCSDIARQAGLSISKVNSILEELQLRRLIVETTPLTHDQFVEPRFQIADGEVAMTTITNELSEDPIPYILQILDRVRSEMPKAVQQGTKAQVWYSRLVLTPEVARRIMEQIIQVMAEFEAMQKPDVSTEAEDQGTRDHYRLSIAFYQVGSTPPSSEA
jgi:hypothetical protein